MRRGPVTPYQGLPYPAHAAECCDKCKANRWWQLPPGGGGLREREEGGGVLEEGMGYSSR